MTSVIQNLDNIMISGTVDGKDLPAGITSNIVFGTTRSGNSVLVFHAENISLQQQFQISSYVSHSGKKPVYQLIDSNELESLQKEDEQESDRTEEDLELEATDAEHLFDKLFELAVSNGASDIHILAYDDDPHVLFRINGELEKAQLKPAPPASKLKRVCRAIYGSMTGDTGSNKNSYRPEKTQKATVTTKISKTDNHRYRLRYQDAALEGQNEQYHVVLRLLDLDRDYTNQQLSDLGYEIDQEEMVYEKMLKGQAGLIIIVGATGDGKTTTAATILGQYAAEHQGRKMILTAEDPVEFKIPGVNHVQVTPVETETESEAWERHLAAKMRMDPDFIFQGETRTVTTAESATHAALTGHTTMVTLHGNSAFDALHRLEELEVKNSLLGSEGFIKGIIFQRLLPVLCPNCSIKASDYEARLTDLIDEGIVSRRQLNRLINNYGGYLPKIRFRNPNGCSHKGCRSGYIGREAAVEIVVPDSDMRDEIAKGKYQNAKKSWKAKGMIPAIPDPEIPYEEQYLQHCVGYSVFDHAVKKMIEGRVSPLDVEDKVDSLSKANVEMDGALMGEEMNAVTGNTNLFPSESSEQVIN